jgi:hypothetical protein
LFHIAHFTFTSTLHFHFGLIQLSTFCFLKCECGHELEKFGTHLFHCPFERQWIATHDTIQDVMYAFIQENGHDVWREQWCALMLGISL